MRMLIRLGVLTLAGVGAKTLYDRYGSTLRSAFAGSSPYGGTDTTTGTDPDAKYEGPGFEDKSFGQAVAADLELAAEIAEESETIEEADARFREEATGAPALKRQARSAS